MILKYSSLRSDWHFCVIWFSIQRTWLTIDRLSIWRQLEKLCHLCFVNRTNSSTVTLKWLSQQMHATSIDTHSMAIRFRFFLFCFYSLNKNNFSCLLWFTRALFHSYNPFIHQMASTKTWIQTVNDQKCEIKLSSNLYRHHTFRSYSFIAVDC